jgi:tRNA-splicing ligase RtcB (3'-phosphate/5'-hydroxy nucleic acid ligase)
MKTREGECQSSLSQPKSKAQTVGRSVSAGFCGLLPMAVTDRCYNRTKDLVDMNTEDFLRLGVPLGQATRLATDFISRFILGGGDKSRLHEEVAAIVANPSAFVDDALRGEFAKALLNAPPPPRAEPVKYRQWGEGLEHDAVMQMEKACLLPVAVAGALMPDAHVGYGLPIGGVLATENAVIPYAVGVDIACRMKMTVLDITLRDLEQKQDRLTRAIEAETRFGVGAHFKDCREHDVLDADWSASPITKQNKDKAWSQLGHSMARPI